MKEKLKVQTTWSKSNIFKCEIKWNNMQKFCHKKYFPIYWLYLLWKYFLRVFLNVEIKDYTLSCHMIVIIRDKERWTYLGLSTLGLECVHRQCCKPEKRIQRQFAANVFGRVVPDLNIFGMIFYFTKVALRFHWPQRIGVQRRDFASSFF